MKLQVAKQGRSTLRAYRIAILGRGIPSGEKHAEQNSNEEGELDEKRVRETASYNFNKYKEDARNIRAGWLALQFLTAAFGAVTTVLAATSSGGSLTVIFAALTTLGTTINSQLRLQDNFVAAGIARNRLGIAIRDFDVLKKKHQTDVVELFRKLTLSSKSAIGH